MVKGLTTDWDIGRKVESVLIIHEARIRALMNPHVEDCVL